MNKINQEKSPQAHGSNSRKFVLRGVDILTHSRVNRHCVSLPRYSLSNTKKMRTLVSRDGPQKCGYDAFG